ncbi:hypothetical protein ANCDUO_09135 [Ancylostoma duodenale]|uniref:Endonuclease/exonuclease/phosphatase domain-containing protein n=1 Tax=Ancylostoma duodenale TaxID=51022 RepID=A0A0C2GNF3_9BILA|nr:hypothetical protein ANCDUO_09135 [Ancylostoma duodenale]
MRKEEGWATGQQPVHVKLPIATETTNKCNTAEKGKSSSSVVTGSLILDPIFSRRNITRIRTSNVRTINQTGRLAQLLQEFDNYRLDILGLSEVRWTGSGCFNSANKTILFSGYEGRHERGVGFVLNKRAAKALVGWKPLRGDRHGIERTVGPFASPGHLSDNGERLISFCACNVLCVGNTYFQHKRIHKKTWISPGGISSYEIDKFCISRKWRTSLCNARAYRGADIGSDHHLVRATLKLKLKQQRTLTITGPFAFEKLKDPVVANSFILELRNRFELLRNTNDIEENRTTAKAVLNNCAEKVIGRRQDTRKEQWIQERTWRQIDERKRVK